MTIDPESESGPEPGPVPPASTPVPATAPALDIRHDAEGGFFSVVVDGVKGYVQYEREADILMATHTVVPHSIGGRGIAGQLVMRLFEHARSEGLKVRPHCSYVAAWARKHPEVANLLA